MKKLKKAGVNVVIFQVRTECDALYKSSYEPWSYWLTGQQGKAPDPFYDPLEIAINESHTLGLELHAWFNPFRAVRNTNAYKISADHVSKKHPEWILNFGKYKMLNPGIPEVRNYIASIVRDVLINYDVDGVHFDDYFYPFTPKISGEDSITFIDYNNGIDDIDDWRRYNINALVAQVYDTINAIKPYVKFGISPFGIVQNHYAGTNGFSSYDNLYCDPLTWIKDKTVDYIIPQLYWEIGKKAADYKALLPWWVSVKGDRHIYIGHYSSKFLNDAWKDKTEISRQIKMNRENRGISGSAFFSSKTITKNISGFADSLSNVFYKYPALVPLMNWKDSIPPLPPVYLKYVVDTMGVTLTWENPAPAPDGDSAAWFVIYKFKNTDEVDLDNSRNILCILSSNINTYTDEFSSGDVEQNYTYVVTSLDRLQNESGIVFIRIDTSKLRL